MVDGVRVPATLALDIIDALLDKAGDALADIEVLDGVDLSMDYGDFLMIGAEDPDADDFASSASTTQDWAHATGTDIDELGTITCAVLSWNGDADLRKAREGVRSILERLGDLLREDSTLDLPNLLWIQPTPQDLDLSQAQEKSGASVMGVFKLYFRARLSAVHTT